MRDIAKRSGVALIMNPEKDCQNRDFAKNRKTKNIFKKYYES